MQSMLQNDVQQETEFTTKAISKLKRHHSQTSQPTTRPQIRLLSDIASGYERQDSGSRGKKDGRKKQVTQSC